MTQEDALKFRTVPQEVHEVLGKHILADGFSAVFDYEKSCGVDLVDSRTGDCYLDLFSFFASMPLGYNHPALVEQEFLEKLGRIATVKPTCSDIYTGAMADFVSTFATIAVPESHRDHLFFVEGGALAVENALKTAFDWKYRKNTAGNGPDTENLEVLHFEYSFHGRSGYTLSLTNTHDPRKYQYFPRFDWPRVSIPACSFPLEGDNLDAVEKLEEKTLGEILAAVAARKDRIAAIIIETIQGEGGDNHFRPEFLQRLREICDEEEMLLIFDEVQTGMGLTGAWWAWQKAGVEPDIFAFGKKSQVCGIASNHRIDDVDSVFKVSSRINSTWGGNLVDMVRCERIIEVIDGDNLLQNVDTVGEHVREGLLKIAAETGRINNVRGEGLMIAFDLSSEDERDAVQERMLENRCIILGCGEKSLRFRPVLDMDVSAADRALDLVRRSL